MLRTEGHLARPDRGAPGDLCTIERTLRVVGNRAAFILMREAGYGTAKFDDFTRRTGLSESVVAARLRELTEAGLLVKVPYRDPGARTRHEYALTEAGEDLIPALLALAEWGDRHRHRRINPTYRHADCGSPVHVALQCEAGHQVSSEDVVVGF